MSYESEIPQNLVRLSAGVGIDVTSLEVTFKRYLEVEDDHIVSYMNNQFFRAENNLVAYLNSSLAEEAKAGENNRKFVYEFIGDYISCYGKNLNDYLKGIFESMYSFFKKESSYKPKEKSLIPIREILLNYSESEILDIVKPAEFHNSLVMSLKIDSKLTSSIRGELWEILGILQNKFASEISFKSKRQVQKVSFDEMKKYVDSDKNTSAIACILRSFIHSLNENYLDEPDLQRLFLYVKTLILPLKATFEVSISALRLFSAQSSLFHAYIMKDPTKLFSTLIGLITHNNKEFKFAVLDTLAVFVKQVVVGISNELENPKMVNLFHAIGTKTWEILTQQTTYQPNANKSEEKNRFAGSVISVVKILGILSPLILSINGKADLKRFFTILLGICGRKVFRAFEEVEGVGMTKKIHVMKLILYNQKELTSFIGSFAKIMEQLEQIEEGQALRLEELFLVGIRQYPLFLEKYIPQLTESMVQFLMGLSTKPQVFGKWTKKVILLSLMENLDAKKFNINTDEDYYKMITKSSSLWKSLLTHPLWHGIVVVQFSKILFENLEHLFLNLDISYKTNIEMEIEEEEKQPLKFATGSLVPPAYNISARDEELQLVNVFFLSDETIQMSNVADYQYISGLALIFNELMATVDHSLYNERVFGFYEQIMYRVKIFPKSIPLMKVIRSLNLYISKTNWFEEYESKKGKQLVSSMSNFFKLIAENIFKYQENYFYEALKMLMSMPHQLFLLNDCEILKNTLPSLIIKSLELGQEIISLSHETISSVSSLFHKCKKQSIKYLTSCIPYLQKYINFSKLSDKDSENQEKEEVRSYLFLYERAIKRSHISKKVMKFLGSVGGISHSMVENTTNDYISWDYHCKLDFSIVLAGDTYNINLTKLLSRTCWLMVNGRETQKIVASQFMHGVVVYMIGRAATKAVGANVESKENISNFMDRVLPTLLNVASNTSHPSQQLIHTLLIQTIHFLANTQDPNSPDIQTVLRHLIGLYTGAEDLSFLASKCLSQLVKWHIKQAPAIEKYPYPIVKTIMRNVWSLVSNKKARNGLIQFLIKFLKIIHREGKLMSVYSLELCSLIISIGRTDKPIEPSLDYLIKKYTLAISPYIKNLVIEEESRKFRKMSTLQKLLQWIYNNALFSVHQQQRKIAFIIWESILTKYGHSFNPRMQPYTHAQPQQNNSNIREYLSGECSRTLKYLFAQNRVIKIEEDEPQLEKVLAKITAYAEMWVRIGMKEIFEVDKLTKFRDFEEVYLQSFIIFVDYLIDKFVTMKESDRILTDATQRAIISCLMSFLELSHSLQPSKQCSNKLTDFLAQRLPFFQRKRQRTLSFIELLLKLLFRPASLISNFNYDIIYECAEMSIFLEMGGKVGGNSGNNGYYFMCFYRYLENVLGNGLYPTLDKFLTAEFKRRTVEIVPYLFVEANFYDREIKCVLNALSAFATNVHGEDHEMFKPILRSTLTLAVREFESEENIFTQYNASKNKMQAEGEQEGQKKLSTEKKALLISYLLQHSTKYSDIKTFLIALLQHNNVIYRKYEKNVLKCIVSNFMAVGEKLIKLIATDKEGLLRICLVLCRMIVEEEKLKYFYGLVEREMIGMGVQESMVMGEERINVEKAKKMKEGCISEMLKISYYMVDSQACDISQAYYTYLFQLTKKGMQTTYSMETNQQAMNLSALLIKKASSQSHLIINKHPLLESFLSAFQSHLQTLTNFYIPKSISKLETSEQRNKCSSFLKAVKNAVIISGDFKLIRVVFPLLKDQELEGFYRNYLDEEIIQGVINECYGGDEQGQGEILEWIMEYFEDTKIDQNNPFNNFRSVLVERVLLKALKCTSQQVLIDFFNRQVEILMNKYIKVPINPMSGIKEILMTIEMKRVAFRVLEQMYSNLPKKDKDSEQQVHQKEYHKQIIKSCVEIVKSRGSEQLMAILRQYDDTNNHNPAEKKEQPIKNIINNLKASPKITNNSALGFYRSLCQSAYNCLIVTFISTQSNKAHFQSYLFESKDCLWRNIIDETQTIFDFEIETNFEEMQSIDKINKKMVVGRRGKGVKDRYWASSLYAIEEEYVPSSLVEGRLQQIDEEDEDKHEGAMMQEENNENNNAPPSPTLELDSINKHPCMINLLRVIDHLHQKFYDGTQPGWMQPLYKQLTDPECPLSIRILLSKLILNRPNIFTQQIWAKVLLKYLILGENGAKFIHYYYRDAVKLYLQFLRDRAGGEGKLEVQGVEELRDVCVVLGKVVKALPHEDNLIYLDNVDILQSLLKIKGVYVDRNLIIKMLKTSESSNSKPQTSIKHKFQWRMCATIVLKNALINHVPVLASFEELQNMEHQSLDRRMGFYFEMRKEKYLALIFEMANESVKKYRITASSFLGELLKYSAVHCPSKLDHEELINTSVNFLSHMNTSESNRNSKQKFSLCTLHTCQHYPDLIATPKLYNQVESALIQYHKEERAQILQSMLIYCMHVYKNNAIGYTEHIFMTLRGNIGRLLNDSLEVQNLLIVMLYECCKHKILQRREIVETYLHIFEDLERVYGYQSTRGATTTNRFKNEQEYHRNKSDITGINEMNVLLYYRMLISLKDFVNDPDLPKSQQIGKLGIKVQEALLKGLGSSSQEVRTLIFSQFQSKNQEIESSLSEKLVNLSTSLYSKEYEELWLVNIVPMLLNLAKKSSDYTRLRFQETLGDLTAYYDWDFRKNMKLINNSQPYTPAFTLASGMGLNKQTLMQGTFNNPSMISPDHKLRGMLRASQNSYLSQEEQVFTILASQSQYIASYGSSYNPHDMSPSLNLSQENPSSTLHQQQQQQQEQQQSSMNKIQEIFGKSRRKRNQNIESFKESNMRKYPAAIKILDNNKIRFNKNFDKSSGAESEGMQYAAHVENNRKGVLIRKYKIGELPDIQITTKDIIDPMFFLANHDHEFASELFLLIFERICLTSRKESKEVFKKIFCELLNRSHKYDYNFISTLQKSLICLCQNQKEKIDFSMKQIAFRSNTLEYGIVFTEENQIQMLRDPDLHDKNGWEKKVNHIWGDLVDLYHHINEDDLIYGVLLKLVSGEGKDLLLEALELKKIGSIKKSQDFFERALVESTNKRIQEFIEKEKIDCETILGSWEPVTLEMNRKIEQKTLLSLDEQRILTVALQSYKPEEKSSIFKKVKFHQNKCEYEKAVLNILCEKDFDLAFHHLEKTMIYFSSEWKKISSFAFSSKHNLLEVVQKTYELEEFLDLFRKDAIKEDQYEELFARWSRRQPNSIYDSNLTWIQLLESRMMYGELLVNKFGIPEQQLAKFNTDWLIQVSNGMVEKGVLGGAEALIKKALACKKKYPKFIWDFYDSVAKLKLKQLLLEKSLKYKDYEVVANLVKKQMEKSNETQNKVSELEQLKLLSLKNDLVEGYLSSCLNSQHDINKFDFVHKADIVFQNYKQLKKQFKVGVNMDARDVDQNYGSGNDESDVLEFKREVMFKFTLFLEKMLSFLGDKFGNNDLKQEMIDKNYDSERLSHVFVETLFGSIEISDFTNNNSQISKQNTIFSLIMKLIKVIQTYPTEVGEYFSQAITNKTIPIWIFLYFIPQMIKFINNQKLVGYFEDLFRNIATQYPEALVYHFNCSYEKESECETAFCLEIMKYLREKMDVNYKFIDGLVLLQYPEIRLRDSLTRLFLPGEREHALDELKAMMVESQLMGKYNRKFLNDWKSKIQLIVNKVEARDSIRNEIQLMMKNLDFNKKKQAVVKMREEFSKISDGSIFFEEYNSNDWNRIQIPGTSYRTFEEPKPWRKVFIESFDHSLLTIMSKQRPKRITLYGSNERKYMLLVKEGEDVRLDQRIEELFDIMNRIMRNHGECSKKQLNIKTFQVTPIRKLMGVFEWVDESQTLKDFLETELKIMKETERVNLKEGNGGFELRMQFLNKICPITPENKDINIQHKTILGMKKNQVIKCFMQCEAQIPYGLLRRALERLSKNYDSFLHIKNTFIANYAVICIIVYVLGIGDRHLENFLIHMSSASVVPIDFGYSFGASIDLGVPELIPFRLTKVFQELMDPIGYEGLFKKSMISCFEAFGENIPLICDYCEVFVDDPLLDWIRINRKNNNNPVGKSSEVSSIAQNSESAFFNEKIVSVREKLEGYNPRLILDKNLKNSRHKHAMYMNVLSSAIWQTKNKEKKLATPDVIEELIGLATDKNILGRTYIGWSPYV